MSGSREYETLQILRSGKTPSGKPLTASDREELLRPYLPDARDLKRSVSPKYTHPSTHTTTNTSPSTLASTSASTSNPIYRRSPQQPTPFPASLLHKLLSILVLLLFSLYLRTRQVYHQLTYRLSAVLYHHHRTPELIRRDIRSLSRLPQHLSVIVELRAPSLTSVRRLRRQRSNSNALPEGVSRLCDDVAEIAAWCASAGIPQLSVYERTGVLKAHIPALHAALNRNLRSYFPPRARPGVRLRAPHQSAYSPPQSVGSPSPSPSPRSASPGASPAGSPRDRSPSRDAAGYAQTQSAPAGYMEGNSNGEMANGNGSLRAPPPHLDVLLLSASDSRDTLIDLTKTLAEMAQRGRLDPADISSDLIDAQLAENSCAEPDLLVVLAPSAYLSENNGLANGLDGAPKGDLYLRGYPPWQARLTEIFHVPDGPGVEYQVFLRALHKYAKASFRFGH